MLAEESLHAFKPNRPANYKIVISGYLEKDWSEQLGMTLAHICTSENEPITILTGELIDQAALFGILNGLYNFGFALLYVQCIQMTEQPH